MPAYPCRQHADCEVIFRTCVPKTKKDESDQPETPEKDENKKVVYKSRSGKPPLMVIHLRTYNKSKTA